MYQPGVWDSDAEDHPDVGKLDDGVESLIVLGDVPLREAAIHPTCFVMGKCAVGVELVLVDPLARNNVGAWWSRYELPGVIVDERLKLVSRRRSLVVMASPLL